MYRPGSLSIICRPAGARRRRCSRAPSRSTGASVAHRGDRGNASSLTLENQSRVISLPSQASTARGYPPDFIIIDEAAQCPDDLYRALRPMQLVAGANMWLLSTPFGKRGFFYEQWTEGGSRWRRVKVTALECPHIDREWLEAERQTSLWFNAEYMGEFTEVSASRVFSDDEIDALFSTEVERWHIIG